MSYDICDNVNNILKIETWMHPECKIDSKA